MSLNLFDVPEVDYQYKASRDVVFQPALTGIQLITFSIPASDDYYDLNELRVQVKVRLTDPATGYEGLKDNLAISDGNNTRNTYCVNNFAHSIFRDMTLSMNVRLQKERQLGKKIVRHPVVRSEIRTFSLMAEPPSGNKTMCLWADFRSDGGFAAFKCVQWRHGQKPLCFSKVWSHPGTTEFEWRRISLQNPTTDWNGSL